MTALLLRQAQTVLGWTSSETTVALYEGYKLLFLDRSNNLGLRFASAGSDTDCQNSSDEADLG